MKFFLDHDVPADIGRVLSQKGHQIQPLREVLPPETLDLAALRYAAKNGMSVITCNRQDFLELAKSEPHCGIIILVRRKSRVAECAAVLRLLNRAGESGIAGNINFA